MFFPRFSSHIPQFPSDCRLVFEEVTGPEAKLREARAALQRMQRPDYRAGRVERAVKVYTVCDESRFLIVRNVPALGCIDDLIKLFGLYGDIEEYRLLDEEDCEPYTDVYWIKYVKYSNARFAKRKLDSYKFLGNLLEVSYGPNYETLADTKNKLEDRRWAVLNRIQVLAQGSGVGPHPVERPDKQLKDPLLVHSLGAEQNPPFPLETLPGTSRDADGTNNLWVPHRMQVTTGTYNSSNQDLFSGSVCSTVQSVGETRSKVSEVNTFASTAKREVSGGPIGQEASGKRLLQEDNVSMTSKKRKDNRRRI